MPVEIRVPPWGIARRRGRRNLAEIGRGCGQPRETIVELETDKVNLDVTATEDGVLSSIARNEGDVVVVGEVLGTITEGAAANNGPQAAEPCAPAEEAAAPAAPIQVAAAPATESRQTPAGRWRRRRCRAPGRGAQYQPATSPGPAPAGGLPARMSWPRQSRTAGRGRGAAPPVAAPALPVVAPAPTTATAAPAAAPAEPGGSAREERVRMSRRRQTIATRLVEAQQTAAMLTTFNEVDMTAVMDLRSRAQGRLQGAPRRQPRLYVLLHQGRRSAR